jgi:hypothetical protein
VPPRYARGRSPPPSPQEGAMNSIVEKGASKGALFLLALQSSFLCGLLRLRPHAAQLAHAESILSRQVNDIKRKVNLIIIVNSGCITKSV